MSIDPDFCNRVVRAAVGKARVYFNIPGEFITYVNDAPQQDQDDATPMLISIQYAYLCATIYPNAAAIKDGKQAWQDAGHEVAHLMSREVCRSADHDGLTEDQQVRMREAIEALTCRLERMFTRDVPYPGDQHFKALPASLVDPDRQVLQGLDPATRDDHRLAVYGLYPEAEAHERR